MAANMEKIPNKKNKINESEKLSFKEICNKYIPLESESAMNKKIIGEYRHPKWLIGFGIIVIMATLYLSIATIIKL
jgi:hypothetical protein